jgi:hypothetical protein
MNTSTPHVVWRRAAIAAAIVSVTFPSAPSLRADHFTYGVQQPAGDANHWNNPIWNPGAVPPTAGNTYEVLNTGRLRSPNGTTASGGTGLTGQTFTFPGDSLTLTGTGFATAGSGELRFKASFNNTTFNFPGVNGNPGLILNGGILNDGDERILTISGLIRANDSTISSINPGGGAVTDISVNRGFLFTGNLIGSGNLTLDYGHDFGAPAPALRIDSSNPAFTGDWTLNAGWLKGAGVNSDFTLTSSEGPSTLDLDYDLFNAAGSLVLSGTSSKLVVDQNLTFGAVTINGTSLAPGTYSAADLNASFDANIVDGGTGTVTVVPEPTGAVAALLGGCTVLLRRRRI